MKRSWHRRLRPALGFALALLLVWLLSSLIHELGHGLAAQLGCPRLLFVALVVALSALMVWALIAYLRRPQTALD
jgi:hypothetical protein